MSKIENGKNIPLNVRTGTIPDMGGALLSWFQPQVFSLVTKQTVGFELIETKTVVQFQGVIQPLSARELFYKPEGQRAWTWWMVHASPSLDLKVDDVITYLERQYRVQAKKPYDIYNYVEYHLVQDWTGSGPEVEG